jgi:putative ABC transport system substrate-binding protein
VLGSAGSTPDDAENTAFREGLGDLGYADGQNITLEWLFPNGDDPSQMRALAADLVGLPVDLIVTEGTSPSVAATRASTTIPIVMAYASDPVGAGLVSSLPHPGGNVTGLAALTGPLGGKRLELLRDAVPGLARVAMLWNPEGQERAHEFEDTAEAARALGLELQSVELRQGGSLDAALAEILQSGAGALFLQTNQVTIPRKSEIVAFTNMHRLPVVSSRRDFAAAGNLMSYGPSFPAMHRRAASFVDRILTGTKPADLPVEQPPEFELVINLKTAQTFGLTIPPSVLQQATEVIQ